MSSDTAAEVRDDDILFCLNASNTRNSLKELQQMKQLQLRKFLLDQKCNK